jgi:hypothetical protein
MWNVLLAQTVKMMQDEIKHNSVMWQEKIEHDPVMCKKYIEAINAQIEYEIELTRKENAIKITSTTLDRDAT